MSNLHKKEIKKAEYQMVLKLIQQRFDISKDELSDIIAEAKEAVVKDDNKHVRSLKKILLSSTIHHIVDILELARIGKSTSGDVASILGLGENRAAARSVGVILHFSGLSKLAATVDGKTKVVYKDNKTTRNESAISLATSTLNAMLKVAALPKEKQDAVRVELSYVLKEEPVTKGFISSLI